MTLTLCDKVLPANPAPDSWRISAESINRYDFVLNTNILDPAELNLESEDVHKNNQIIHINVGTIPSPGGIEIISFPVTTDIIFDTLTTISWRWKIKDTNNSDGIFIFLYIGDKRLTLIGSHSNYTFPNTLICDERSRVWIEHKVSVYQILRDSKNLKTLLGKRIAKISIGVIEAFHQELWLDYIDLDRERLRACEPVRNFRFVHSRKKLADEFRPSSVCLLDIDNDNDLDMYLVNQRGTNYLKLNDGSGKFSPAEYLVSPDPSIRNAHAAFADINDDGWLDLYESREYSHNMIYLNRGNLSFTAYKPYTDITDDISQTYATLWADFNGDNLIDLFEISPSTLNNIIISNKLKILINQADSFQIFKFGKNAAFYGGAMGDIRKDGSLCIFLANYGYPNFLFSLTKETQPALCDSIDFPGKPQLQIFRKSEGAVFFDIDNDGDLDLYVCNEDSVNELYLWKNNQFIEDAERRGLDDKLDSEGFLIADFDQDMDWDIYILHTYQPNTLLLNNGHGYFFEQTAGSGFEDPGGWRGAACGDVDNDGDIDVVLVDPFKGERLIINPVNSDNYLKIDLRGQPGNYFGIRGQINIYEQGVNGEPRRLIAYHQTTCGDGFQYDSFARQFHFGLNAQRKYIVEVYFSDGKKTVENNITAARTVTILYPSSNIFTKTYNWLNFYILQRFFFWLRAQQMFYAILLLILLGLFINYIKTILFSKPLYKFSLAIPAVLLLMYVLHDLKIIPWWTQAFILTAMVFSSELMAEPVKYYLSKHYLRENSWDHLFEHLKAFRHGGVALKNLDRLIFLYQNISDFEGEMTLLRNRISDAARTYINQTSWQIQQIIYLLKDLRWDRSDVRSLGNKNKFLINQFEEISSGHPGYKNNSFFLYQSGPIVRTVKYILSIIGKVHGQLVPHYTCYPLEILKEVYSEKFEGIEINMTETLPHNKKVLIKGYELGNIIADLLQNAIRLTGKNKFRGKISVTEDQRNIIMDVEDNGPGIPLRYRRKIFEKGFTTNPDGGGFGLYYAKQILAKYDGNIRLLKTVSGEGSVFRIILKQINYE